MSDDLIITDRAVTLWQPHASLMAIGVKKNETRSRQTKYRGWLAIHAAVNFPEEARALIGAEPFWSCLKEFAEFHNPMQVPLGVVLAVVRVIDCRPTAYAFIDPAVTLREKAFGDYRDGRFYYVTDAVRRLKKPLPQRGAQTIPWKLRTPITEGMLL